MPAFIMVTGCAGFIGRVVTRKLLERGDYVYGVDRLDYAATTPPAHPRFELRPVDVRTLGRLPDVDAVIHCAASTHVDNSLSEAEDFVANNVGTTAKLLELVRAKSQHGMPHLVHVSTDEVYGPAQAEAFHEDAPLTPTSPYAASKAAADLLVQAWVRTYGVPAAIMRPTNCYGLGQYPEKLIPKVVRACKLGRPMPIHSNGNQQRYWLAVEDAANALIFAAKQRLSGIYNISGNCEASVIDVASAVVKYCGNTPASLLSFGFERPACDFRYAVNDTALRDAGWTPTHDFWTDLQPLVEAELAGWRW